MNDFVEKASSRVKSSVETIKTTLNEFGSGEHIDAEANRWISEYIEILENDLDAALDNRQDAVGWLAALDTWEAELNLLDNKLLQKLGPIHVAIRSWAAVKALVISAIKAAAAHLWQLLRGLLTLREWSVKGTVGNLLFGLGSAEVTLTFSP